jgi:hypothetical protein
VQRDAVGTLPLAARARAYEARQLLYDARVQVEVVFGEFPHPVDDVGAYGVGVRARELSD